MKLFKYINRKIGDKEYKKYSIIIPPFIVEQLGWEVGVELDSVVEGNKLIIQIKND